MGLIDDVYGNVKLRSDNTDALVDLKILCSSNDESRVVYIRFFEFSRRNCAVCIHTEFAQFVAQYRSDDV